MAIHFYIAWTQRENLWLTCKRGELLMRNCQKLRSTGFIFQIFKELTDRVRKRKEAAAEITEEPWMILLIDDIKECSKLPDDIQLQLHRIMTKTKGYGVLVLCGIRQGDLSILYAGSAWCGP